MTGITQTVRNFGASLGLAGLGATLISENLTNIAAALMKDGVPSAIASKVAAPFGSTEPSSGSAFGQSPVLVHDVQMAFAQSTQTVFYIMAGVMAAGFLAALLLPPGRMEAPQG